MQAQPEPSHCGNEDGSEDMEYMMEIPFECDNGNEAVSFFIVISFTNKKKSSKENSRWIDPLPNLKFIDFKGTF